MLNLKNSPFTKIVTGILFVLIISNIVLGTSRSLNAPITSEKIATFFVLFVSLAASMLAIRRGILSKDERLPWILIAAAGLFNALGEFSLAFLAKGNSYPSIADMFFIPVYFLLALGLWGISTKRMVKTQKGFGLDASITAFTIIALFTTFLLVPIANSLQGNITALATTILYPLGSLFLSILLGSVLAYSGWKIPKDIIFLALGTLSFLIADLSYTYGTIENTYVYGGFLSTFYVTSFGFFGLSALTKKQKIGHRKELKTDGMLIAPIICGIIVSAILTYGNFHEENTLSLIVSFVALVLVLEKTRKVFSDSKKLSNKLYTDSITDALTLLYNRRKFNEDLEKYFEKESKQKTALVFFDLNGFKYYNDIHGHLKGDQLLASMAQKLNNESKKHNGQTYRLGGDEFCILFPYDKKQKELDNIIVSLSQNLLLEEENCLVDAAWGLVLLDQESSSAEEALKLADERMYANKSGGRTNKGREMCDLLLQALAARSKELGEHNDDVAFLAKEVAKRMDMSPSQIEDIIKAAELHDVGKVAIPDAILFKEGPLTDDEWIIMKQHTVVGERILQASSALRPVARLVRSSHEKYDGSGYPDSMIGEEIPLGARILTACDSYDAMTTDRPYRKGMSQEEAIQELKDCSGAHFDPEVVNILIDILNESNLGLEHKMENKSFG